MLFVDVAFNQKAPPNVAYVDVGSSTSNLSPFGSMCSTFSSTWWCTIIQLWLLEDYSIITYHMYHIGISQGASDDWAEHYKASKYLESWYWTLTFKAYRISFFMLLCALVSGPITLWIIICTFCSILPWWSSPKALCISFSQTCFIHLSPQLSRDLLFVHASRHHTYYLIFITMYLTRSEGIWVKLGTIVISCTAHGIYDFDELTNFCRTEIHNLVVWVGFIDYLGIVTQWVMGIYG